MLLRQLLLETYNKNIVHEFIKFAVKRLQLQSLPKSITMSNDTEFVKNHLSFGSYRPTEQQIHVYVGNRHIVDVLRTLAHELSHHKQEELGKHMDGRTGSPIENEANASAGILMRQFKELHPEIFS